MLGLLELKTVGRSREDGDKHPVLPRGKRRNDPPPSHCLLHPFCPSIFFLKNSFAILGSVAPPPNLKAGSGRKTSQIQVRSCISDCICCSLPHDLVPVHGSRARINRVARTGNRWWWIQGGGSIALPHHNPLSPPLCPSIFSKNVLCLSMLIMFMVN